MFLILLLHGILFLCSSVVLPYYFSIQFEQQKHIFEVTTFLVEVATTLSHPCMLLSHKHFETYSHTHSALCQCSCCTTHNCFQKERCNLLHCFLISLPARFSFSSALILRRPESLPGLAHRPALIFMAGLGTNNL